MTNDTFFVLTDWDLAIDPSAVQFELEERDTLWPEIAPLGLDRIRFVGVRIGQNANLPSSPPSLLPSFLPSSLVVLHVWPPLAQHPLLRTKR